GKLRSQSFASTAGQFRAKDSRTSASPSQPICGENDHFEACADLDIERPTSDLEREEVFPEEYG
ncbi:hypothetical protein Tco_1397486, partial [Tanacetum coccineum]